MNEAFKKLSPVNIFALTIDGEAENQGEEGQIAVGSVILERVDHRDWDGKTVQEVCLKPAQFSCYIESEPVYDKLLKIAENWDEAIESNRYLKKCQEIAVGLLSGEIPRTKEISDNHCCQYIVGSYRKKMDKKAEALTGEARKAFDKKRWWIRMELILTVKDHEFYA